MPRPGKIPGDLAKILSNQDSTLSKFSRQSESYSNTDDLQVLAEDIPQEFSSQNVFSSKADGIARQQERPQFSRQTSIAGVPSQGASSGFSRQSTLSRKPNDIEMQNGNGMSQSKVNSQSRRIGLSKPGRMISAGLIPGGKSLIQRSSLGQQSGQGNTGIKVRVFTEKFPNYMHFNE